MKRLIVFALVLSVAMFSTFAAQAVDFTETADASSNNATLNLQFVIDEDTGSFKFGFNNAIAHTEMTESTVDLTYEAGKIKNDSDIYVWWDILYGGKYNLELSVSENGLWSNDQSKGIDIKVVSTPVGESDGNSVTLTTADTGENITGNILSQISSGTITEASGEQKLEIESTTDLAGLTNGTYVATLTLKLTTT